MREVLTASAVIQSESIIEILYATARYRLTKKISVTADSLLRHIRLSPYNGRILEASGSEPEQH